MKPCRTLPLTCPVFGLGSARDYSREQVSNLLLWRVIRWDHETKRYHVRPGFTWDDVRRKANRTPETCAATCHA